MINVNTKFDGGSIEIIDITNPQQLHFKIRKDTNSDFAQWFYFQLNNIQNQEINCTFSDLKNTAYPAGWENYNVCISYDNQNWSRLSANFDGDNLTFTLPASNQNSIWLAYFEPYSYDRHMQLIGEANNSSIMTHEVLGLTAQGRNIDLLTTGNHDNPKHKVWIIARQHPGETMAEWFMEGAINKLLDKDDAMSKVLRNDCIFYLVPNMNPDGGYNGNLRVNTAGANLNREWLTPTLERSPEVYHVRNKMLETGVDFFFDIHGDEALPYIFTAGCSDNPSYSEQQAQATESFREFFEMINPDYQREIGYPPKHFNREKATVATNWVGDKFDCVALTLEMPFKDNANYPDEAHNWDGHRSVLLGRSLLDALGLHLRK